MSPADLARLELAKAAYQATRPRPMEVQTGVRRARLWLGRPRPRRAWFSKGLVLVVLAIGSLAYAKPQVWGPLVRNALEPNQPTLSRRTAGASAPAPTAPTPVHTGNQPISPVTPAADEALGAPQSKVTPPVSAPAPIRAQGKLERRPKAVRDAAPSQAVPGVADESPAPPLSSDWARVGRALATGDDRAALAALEQLSKSDEQSTRHKADLGRVQLLMSRGRADEACALGRALLRRAGGSSVERQPPALLKSCAR